MDFQAPSRSPPRRSLPGWWWKQISSSLQKKTFQRCSKCNLHIIICMIYRILFLETTIQMIRMFFSSNICYMSILFGTLEDSDTYGFFRASTATSGNRASSRSEISLLWLRPWKVGTDSKNAVKKGQGYKVWFLEFRMSLPGTGCKWIVLPLYIYIYVVLRT